MTKAEVEDEQLGKCVIMPQSCELSFMVWWKQLTATAIVNVQYPHHRHGNSGKPSHSAKKDAKSDFLTFLDTNSQPNGRSSDSTSATHFFAEFPNYSNSHKDVSISNYSASTWLISKQPKHSIYPHSLDYCDYSAKKEELRRNHTILNQI